MAFIEAVCISIDGHILDVPEVTADWLTIEFTPDIDSDGAGWIPAEVTPEGWQWLREIYGPGFFDESPDEGPGALIEDLIPEAIAEWKATRDQ